MRSLDFCDYRRNMTMKALRSVLEQDLELEEDALKPMKKTVSGFVDNVRYLQ